MPTGFGEQNIAALQAVFCAVQEDVAFDHVDAAESTTRIKRGAADAQIGVAGNLGQRSLHLQLGRGGHVDVEMQAIHRGIRLRRCRRLRAARQVHCKIKSWIQSKTIDRHIAG